MGPNDYMSIKTTKKPSLNVTAFEICKWLLIEISYPFGQVFVLPGQCLSIPWRGSQTHLHRGYLFIMWRSGLPSAFMTWILFLLVRYLLFLFRKMVENFSLLDFTDAKHRLYCM